MATKRDVVTVERVIPAPAAAIFDVLADPGRHTEFDEGRRIAWSPKPASGRGARFVGRIWRYELVPVEGGTQVRETWDISAEAGRFVLRYLDAARTRENMAKSLERLDHLVTAGA